MGPNNTLLCHVVLKFGFAFESKQQSSEPFSRVSLMNASLIFSQPAAASVVYSAEL